jgi:hypothetical protein
MSFVRKEIGDLLKEKNVRIKTKFCASCNTPIKNPDQTISYEIFLFPNT